MPYEKWMIERKDENPKKRNLHLEYYQTYVKYMLLTRACAYTQTRSLDVITYTHSVLFFAFYLFIDDYSEEKC